MAVRLTASGRAERVDMSDEVQRARMGLQGDRECGRTQCAAELLWYASGMKTRLCIVAGSLLCAVLPGRPAWAEEQFWSLSADTWAQPRDGRSVAQMAPLPELAAAWLRQPGQRIVVRYPGGEEGLLWAHELRSWLIALGIPGADQELVAGSHQADRIELELVAR